MDPSALVAYLAAATALMVLPGPDWAFVLAAGTRERLVLPAAAGLTIGYVLMAVVVAVGIGPIVTAAPAVLAVVTVLGAAYLVYLGVALIRAAPVTTGEDLSDLPAALSESAATPQLRSARLLRRGVGVSSLNPKSLVLFVALFPQFVRPSAPWPLPAQLVMLGLIWAAISGIFYSGLGLAARSLLGGRPALGQVVTRIAGAAMIVGGLILVGEQALHALR